MAKTNSNSTLESLVSDLVTTHVDILLQDLTAGPAQPIGNFALDGSSLFVVYAANGTPLGFGGSESGASASSRNQARKLVSQLASLGMVTTYRSISIPSDNLVGVLGRMIGGLLGSSVMQIGDGIGRGGVGEADESAPRRGRPAGRPAGARKGGRKGKGGSAS